MQALLLRGGPSAVARGRMLACGSSSSSCTMVASVPAARRVVPAPCSLQQDASPQLLQRRALFVSRANQEKKSWGEIGAEVLGVAKDVVTKIKDTASSAIEGLTAGKKAGSTPQQQQQRKQAPLYRPDDDRQQLPLFPGGGAGGLLGGLVGGLVNSAVKGLASQLEKAAAETRSVGDEAAARIMSSARVRQRLGGDVRVGPPMSQSVSTQSINGRVQRAVSLVLPVYGAGGAMATATVTSTEGSAGQQQQEGPRITVRLPEGDTIVLDSSDGGGGGRAVGIDAEGEVVEAEFRDLK